MTGNAALTEEMTRLLDEHPREARENRFSASLCGEMAVMRLLHNGTKKKMTAGELSSRLSMTTSRVAACEKRKAHFKSKIALLLSMLGDDAPEFVRLLGRMFEITSSDAFRQGECIEEDQEGFNG